jgi:hypothetical protein
MCVDNYTKAAKDIQVRNPETYSRILQNLDKRERDTRRTGLGHTGYSGVKLIRHYWK